MNEQQGKHLDERLRQALDTLSDVPAPGSTFDAGKFWEQLRPELAAETVVLVSKRTGQVRWLVAASLVGMALFLGWLLRSTPALNQTQINRQTEKEVVKHVPIHLRERTQPKQTPLIASSRSRKRTSESPKGNVEKSTGVSAHTTDATNSQLTVATANVPVDLPVAEALPTELTAVQLPPTAVTRKAVPTYPKRRFAVVHQNELRAEAETRAKLERNDRFVRLGSAPVSDAPLRPIETAEEKIRLIIPLN
ncbi:hypothetical protein [Fibrella forsythiae]|uniref:Uncharacterized protein n=1 Tax=Fibrella forsythiae TaxID=2817061 RepID=A0ABS3JLL7_9BACT|nr:hypothetical protein [Fibrella forsythiae]MBO0950099.1 hypothetical protein [Fibrella forsythiae]